MTTTELGTAQPQLVILIFLQKSPVVQTKKISFYHINLSQKSNFILQISQLQKILQNWFCIQNLCMDLIFQEKTTVCKSVTWFTSYNNFRVNGEFSTNHTRPMQCQRHKISTTHTRLATIKRYQNHPHNIFHQKESKKNYMNSLSPTSLPLLFYVLDTMYTTIATKIKV